MKRTICYLLTVVMLFLAFAAGCSAEAVEPISVRVTANPAGADVYVDGEFSGLTAPCTVQLSAGKHEISFRIPGYELTHRQ